MSGHRLDARVVIVGGGTPGAATALALQRVGVPTVVVERPARPDWKIGEALPPAANPLLRRLGVWDRLLADGHQASSGNATAWGSAELVDHSFIFDPNGEGWHLDRPKFDVMLLQAARDQGAEVVIGTAAIHERSAPGEELWLRVTPDGGEETLIQAPFVVDASGRTAALARRLGRERDGRQDARREHLDRSLEARREHLDRLVGAVGVLATRDPRGGQDARTLVEAVENGWWYSAAVPGGRLVVAFMTDGDVATRLAAHRLDGWSRLLGETVHTRARVVAQEYRVLVPPRAVLANSSRQQTVAGPGWLAVGDAAIAHDPLSSQGMASALLLSLSAADAIRDRLQGGQDALAPYHALVERLYAYYLRNLAYFYRQETRWPRSPFWARRVDYNAGVSALVREQLLDRRHAG